MATQPRTSARAAAMVEALRERGCINRPDVAEAFLSVPRHVFVPSTPLDEVYAFDAVIPTHFGSDGLSTSSSSAPTIMATMLEQLDVGPGMRVLEIGAGTGYNAGLLAYLVGVRGDVVSVDLDGQVADEARRHLRDAGVTGVRVVSGDGWLGAAEHGPFDRVIVTVGAWEISVHWFEQLRVGGVLVMPLWLRPGAQLSVAFVRDEDRLHSVRLCGCGFMRLRGPHAGPDAHVAVRGWGHVVGGAISEREWVAAIENATPDRVAQLRALLREPAAVAAAPVPAPGWTMRLALEAPDAIELSSRTAPRHIAFGLFSSDRNSLAVFDAGTIVSFGDPFCADRLRNRLPTLEPLPISDLEVDAVPHPAGAVPDAWILERPRFDLVVRRARHGLVEP